ncbi:unnamed protein product [Callosobruchus maculatus]|uniref:CLIP domain-containing serine protease n=1 Tax=Callosobruchus maculatus TaxID=64391 RepID=A0A653DC88_CALMS|nr:unnamed protein product [Callosobruchus maculatus]
MRAIIVTVLFVSISVLVNGDLGDICLTPNNERATCKSIYDCNILLSVIRTKDQRQLRFLKQSQCEGYYNGDPLVCCGTDNNFALIATTTQRGRRPRPTTTTTTERQEYRDWDNGGDGGERGNSNSNRGRELLPSINQCGFQEVDRIYGGTETAIGEFPWMAMLQYQNTLTGSKRYACGGSLISARYVLTAGHCVAGEIEQKVGRLIKARLGEHDTRQERDCISDRVCNQPPVDMDVQSFHAHPNYNPDDQQKYNDIALVKLRDPVRFTTYIRPICLPQPGERASVGQKVTVAGWGRTERRTNSPVKLKVQIPIADSDVCRNVFSRAGFRLRRSQICAGGERGKDSCTGDSGGPLMKTRASDSSQWYIEGIVSYGAQCGTEGWPAVYTNVASFLDWIYETVTD